MQILIANEPVPPQAVTFLELGFGRGGPGPEQYRIIFPLADFLDRLGGVYAACVEELREDDRLTGEFEPPYPGASDYPDLEPFLREHGEHFTEFVQTYFKFDILRLALEEGRADARLVVTSVDRVRAAGDQVMVEGTARAAAMSGTARVATLNDLSDEEMAEARAILREVGRSRVVKHLTALVERCDYDQAASFVEEVLAGGAEARSWRRRDRLCYMPAATSELATRPLDEILASLGAVDGKRWVRERPLAPYWLTSSAIGAPAVLVRQVPYWWSGPAGAASSILSADRIEEVSDLAVAGRRWIATRAAWELRSGPLPPTTDGIAAALGVAGRLSRDADIALSALVLEWTVKGHDDRPLGYRGPDDWYRTPARAPVLVVTADEAIWRGLPPVEIGVNSTGAGVVHSAYSRPAGCYLLLHSMPGGTLNVTLWAAGDGETADADAMVRSFKRTFDVRSDDRVREVGPLERVELAGGERPAVCLHGDLPGPLGRAATCVVRIDHERGALLAAFTVGVARDESASCAQVLAHPGLAPIARSLRVG